MARNLEFETNSITHPFPPPGQIHGCALAEPSGPWRLTFGLRRLKIFFFHTNHMQGTLDFTGSELWAPFNFHCGEKWN